MLKVKTGLIKKVLSDEQFELINKNLLNPKDITLIDTIKTYTNKDGLEVEYIPIRLSSREMDKDGNEKFIFDTTKNEYLTSFAISKTMVAYGKELRILLELGEHHPVKVVVDEIEDGANTKCKIVCIQDQLIGTLE